MKTVGLLCGYCMSFTQYISSQIYVSTHAKTKHKSIFCLLKCLNSLLMKGVSNVFSSQFELKPRIQDESSLVPAPVREGSLGFLLYSELFFSLRDPCSHLLIQLNLETLVTAEVDNFSLWPCPSW